MTVKGKGNLMEPPLLKWEEKKYPFKEADALMKFVTNQGNRQGEILFEVGGFIF